jgi:hypothetical protein
VNNLFIRLYLDEDVNVLIAELLRARGFDAITARDAGQLNATVDILAAVKRTAIPHHATFLGWSLNGVDADSEKRLIA